MEEESAFDKCLTMLSNYKAETKRMIAEANKTQSLAQDILKDEKKLEKIVKKIHQLESVKEKTNEKVNKIMKMYQDYLGFKLSQTDDEDTIIVITLTQISRIDPEKKFQLKYNVKSKEIIYCRPNLKNLDQLKAILSTEENQENQNDPDNWPKFLVTLRESWKSLTD